MFYLVDTNEDLLPLIEVKPLKMPIKLFLRSNEPMSSDKQGINIVLSGDTYSIHIICKIDFLIICPVK